MAQRKFDVGDIVEHVDGSLYLIVGDSDHKYTCVTFQETNEAFRSSGSPYVCAYHIANEKLIVIGHLDEAV